MRTKPFPTWAEKALQGVTFWMGHRHSLYRDYPLSEGAIIAELCNIIFANLGHDYSLACEVKYSEISKMGSNCPYKPGARVDLFVSEKANKKRSYAIEVKRWKGSISQLNDDIKRLAYCKENSKLIRTFLFVISESSRPKPLVNEAGASITIRRDIEGTNCYYKVRRTCKAAHAFSKHEKAQYACLLEIFKEK